MSNSKPDAANAYASYQGLLQLVRITGQNSDEVRGACKRCGRVGHLTYQCRNFLSVKNKEKEAPEVIQTNVSFELGKLEGKLGKAKGKDVVKTDSEDEDEDIESSDSDYDSYMERLIAQSYGKKSFRKDKLEKKNKESRTRMLMVQIQILGRGRREEGQRRGEAERGNMMIQKILKRIGRKEERRNEEREMSHRMRMISDIDDIGRVVSN